MLQVYVRCGVWRSLHNKEWKFIVDQEKGGRLLTLESITTLEELKMMVLDDYRIEENMVDVELSYLPSDLIINLESPPIIITNDRQVRNLVGYLKKKAAIGLCVTFKARVENQRSHCSSDTNEASNTDLNQEPHDSSDGTLPEKSEQIVNEGKTNADLKSNCSNHVKVGGDDGLLSQKFANRQKNNRLLVDSFKNDQHFRSKGVLKATLKIHAMKYNFDYRVTKSDPKLWCIRCKDNSCNWRLRAECFEGSTYFKINKYVGKHTCSPSEKSNFSRTASTKTIGELIMHKYEGVKEGPKPNDIIHYMRTEHGCELTYCQAWEYREYAVHAVRGIPEKSFAKIPKYLHMLKEANPGTHTHYEVSNDGRFRFLFISFGQCVRGFYKAIRRVIVVDGTFLKSKYKGVLLVATSVDGNSNLYPIAFGVVDSENDHSWEWFKINKYVGKHTCSPSEKSNFSRTASTKTIGELIMHKYEGVKEGPKPNDIIHYMRTEHGCELTYCQAWEYREYAVHAVRGIPEKSFAKIPKYLHMLKEANPGTHTHYEVSNDGRFRFLFISFGQCVRGFYKAIRRVIVVDGTFLKSKYKGVLLVATSVDGNSNLYPIAFGVVDSENDHSWEWFLMQLKVVIADDEGLAFVSYRNNSIGKSLGKVYPLARHGICIHHLLNNVVTYFKEKGLAALVAKASKAYRVADFQKIFALINNIAPLIGKYLEDADVQKWARCMFPGYRYDIRTTNPAESINSALRSPREYPLIPLLDSIREILTRWFYERRELSLKHKDPLTIEVEKKIQRRIEKAKTLILFPVTTDRFQVKGDKSEYVVDLARKTCSCGKFDLGKIPCRHAIKAAFSIDKNKKLYPLTDEVYSTTAWRAVYEESINPIAVPEDEWKVPQNVQDAKVLPPETRQRAGRRKKRRHETVEDKIKSSQGSQGSKKHKCSRCGIDGHNRRRCEVPI